MLTQTAATKEPVKEAIVIIVVATAIIIISRGRGTISRGRGAWRRGTISRGRWPGPAHYWWGWGRP